jgi:hypothetical protein
MPKLIKNQGGKQASKTSIATAAIKEERETILVLVTQGEKYVYLDDDKISDDKDSILEVFTSKMEVQSVDISNAYQYAPIIESVEYLKGLDTCGESRPSDDNDEDKSQGANVSFAIMDATMLQPTMEALVDKDMWITDTGATSHVINSKVGGKNHRKTTVKTRGFVGESINPDLEVNILVRYTCGNGKEIKAELKDVQVNEKFNFNLFSVTRMLQKGYKLKGDAKSITLEKGNHAFAFDSVIWTQGGALYCARFCRNKNSPLQHCNVASAAPDTSEETTTKAKEALKNIFKIKVKRAHKYLGHLSKDTTRLTAKYLGMNLSHGTLPVCKLCAIAKVKQKNVPKETSGMNKATEFNDRVFHDLSKIKVPEELGQIEIAKSNWHIAVDKALGYKRSAFFVTKRGIVDNMCKYMHSKKERGFPIQILRQDNAKEILALIKAAKGKDWKLTIAVELTARNTLQQKLKVKMAFTVIAAQARSMLIAT